MFKSNTHTHTIYCDGHNTPDEMVQKAVELGFVSLGFSVHSPMFFENDYAISREKLPEYYNEINTLKDKYSGIIEIYNGIELDSDYIDISEFDFDYIIASVHQIHKGGKIYYIDYSKEMLSECVNNEFKGSFIKMAGHYYNELVKFVIDIKPQVVGHFDLIEKFNSDNDMFDRNCDEYKHIVEVAIKKISECCPGQIFEINTGAMFRLKNELIYPSEVVMECLKKYGMKLTLNSDSHSVDSLNFGFETALEYCRKFGFETVSMLRNGNFEEISI